VTLKYLNLAQLEHACRADKEEGQHKHAIDIRCSENGANASPRDEAPRLTGNADKGRCEIGPSVANARAANTDQAANRQIVTQGGGIGGLWLGLSFDEKWRTSIAADVARRIRQRSRALMRGYRTEELRGRDTSILQAF
jgi:hypothetical protein